MRIYKRGKVYHARFWDASIQDYDRRSTRCTDRAAAELVAKRWEQSGADPDRAALEGATLEAAFDDLNAENEARVREKKMAHDTADFYKKRTMQLRRLVVEGFLPRLLADLRPRHVDAAIDSRRAQGVSAHTIAKDLIALRLTLKLAKRRGKWKGDIAEVMPRFGAGYTPRARWLPPHDLAALLAELRPDRGAWVAFAIATSANLSEAAKARRDDVIVDRDLKPEKVHVRGTKRDTRDRKVPIVYDWQSALLEAALSALPAKGALFTSWTKIDRDLKAACRRARIAPVSTNDLRRTFGVWMRASGARIEDLSPMLGHADGRMAERVYARINVEQLVGLLRGAPVLVQPVCKTEGHEPDSADHSDDQSGGKRGGSSNSGPSAPPINRTVNHRVAGSSPAAGAQKQRIILEDSGHCAAGVHEVLAPLANAVGELDAGWDALERMVGSEAS